MFETAALDRKVSKGDFKRREGPLREALLMAQGRLRKAGFPVIVLFAGVDGAGKGEMVNELNNWLDPHYVATRPLGDPSPEEQERPKYWRYWRDLPPKGQIGLFLSAWYHAPLLDHVYKRTKTERFDQDLDEVLSFEKMLADDGALILKFWMHLDKKAQKKRLSKLEKDPLERFRVTEDDWKHWRMYDDFVATAEHIITRTSTGQAPWHIVEGADANFRSLRVGELLLQALTAKLDEEDVRKRVTAEAANQVVENVPTTTAEEAMKADVVRGAHPTVLDTVDLSVRLPKKEYQERLREAQAKLRRQHREARDKKISMVIVFEGWDAAGKGGAIRRLVSALDARSVRTIPIAAPTDEERAQHYLWRFWRHLSRVGRVTIFDRSWYGRVLVERVEGFAREKEWRRAYAEINDFERRLCNHGIVVSKFWLHISPEEQARRFAEREQTPYKRWKLTEEDWRNRSRWGEYEQAVHDMVERTSTRGAPWHLVAADDKYNARATILETVVAQLAEALKK